VAQGARYGDNRRFTLLTVMNADTPNTPPPDAPEALPAEGAEPPPSPDAAPAATPDAAPVAAPAAAEPGMTVKACADELRTRFPALFGEPKPLKLRIQVDINERAPGVFPKPVLSAFFRRYTLSDAYLKAVSTGTQRFDLDGQPAGELSEEHRKIALETLLQRRDQRRGQPRPPRPTGNSPAAPATKPPDPEADARRKAQREAQREEARAKHREAQRAERNFRAGLLRAFETTTLTRENFCALKGVDPAALDGLLEAARADRAQRQTFLAELSKAYRESGLSINEFAASKNMHPGQMHHLLREAQGGGDDRRPAPRGDRPPRGGDRAPRREGQDRPRGPRH
jgi:sRNA-binding protein